MPQPLRAELDQKIAAVDTDLFYFLPGDRLGLTAQSLGLDAYGTEIQPLPGVKIIFQTGQQAGIQAGFELGGKLRQPFDRIGQGYRFSHVREYAGQLVGAHHPFHEHFLDDFG